ncbi:MAG: hypothetical protein IKA64_00985 [Clostridia bacterium]|nr:hypothetical protein [Clostridia bacterium]
MKKRAIFPKITLALIFICIPNINIIDFLPDFVAYFLLWSIIGELDRMLPYFAELKTALKRLGLVTLIKLPATLVMFANLHTGRDIIPLFTLIFSVIELILIIQAVNLAYSALSYLGERSGASSLIMPFKVLFGRMSTDTLRSVTCVYAVLRAALAFIPEICLLTYSNDNLALYMRVLYPILATACISLSFLFGIVWASIASCYKRAVKRDGAVRGAAGSLISEERHAELHREREAARRARTLRLLAVASIFSIDIFFRDIKNTNILPHFIWYILLMCVLFRVGRGWKMRLLGASAFALASLANIGADIHTADFFSEYELADLLNSAAAADAYSLIEAFTALECVLFLVGLVALAVSFIPFALRAVSVHSDCDTERLLSEPFVKRTKRTSVLLFSLMGIISILKCLGVILTRSVRLIYTDPGDVTQPVIAASPTPWLPAVIFALSVILIIFSFNFTSDLKEDINSKN